MFVLVYNTVLTLFMIFVNCLKLNFISKRKIAIKYDSFEVHNEFIFLAVQLTLKTVCWKVISIHTVTCKIYYFLCVILSIFAVFCSMCYEGSVDLNSISDWTKRHPLEVQIMEFGQIPKQIFLQPHPKRITSRVDRPLGCSSPNGESLELLFKDCPHLLNLATNYSNYVF